MVVALAAAVAVVLAAKDNRDALFLDRCWFGVSERLAAPHLSGRQSQLRKIHKLLLICWWALGLIVACACCVVTMMSIKLTERFLCAASVFSVIQRLTL